MTRRSPSECKHGITRDFCERCPDRDEQLAAIAHILDSVDTWLSRIEQESAPESGMVTAGALRTYVQSARLLNVLPQRKKRTRAATVRPPRRSTVDTLERSLSGVGGRSR
jgi:hypothetical protein